MLISTPITFWEVKSFGITYILSERTSVHLEITCKQDIKY